MKGRWQCSTDERISWRVFYFGSSLIPSAKKWVQPRFITSFFV